MIGFPRSSPLFVLGLMAGLLVPGSVAAQFEEVRHRIEQILVADGLPSISVAVAKDGKIIWERGFGWADREKRIPATEHTMYSLASITKPITATGLMVLVEHSLVDMDQPVNRYLESTQL